MRLSLSPYHHLHSAISKFLSLPATQRLVGADPSFSSGERPYSQCDKSIHARFWANLDRMFPTQFYIAALLERGVRALVYAGASDWVCNWVRCIFLVVSLCSLWQTLSPLHTGAEMFRCQAPLRSSAPRTSS